MIVVMYAMRVAFMDFNKMLILGMVVAQNLHSKNDYFLIEIFAVCSTSNRSLNFSLTYKPIIAELYHSNKYRVFSIRETFHISRSCMLLICHCEAL